MKKTDSQTPNPALQELERFVGEWEMVLSNASFLPDVSDTLTGQVSIEWLESGAFLVMYMGGQPQGTPDAIWHIGRDESTHDYTVLYYDNRRVSRVYGMSFSDGLWKMWRNSPGFSQRFEGKFSEDGNTVTASWEISSDGSTWEHDFDVTYRKVG
jgi:hypothetical protein